MATLTPSGKTLGCKIEGIDLSKPLGDGEFLGILKAIADYGVVCFPKQNLEPAAHKAFASRFGSLEINVAAGPYTAPGHPEVMILSNVIENGKALGLKDAGQDWHTDMSYSKPIAFLNVLHAIKVPLRNGAPLGNTEFLNTRAAYDDLPNELKKHLGKLTATHDFNKFWEEMLKRPGTPRKPLTPEQRKQKPPVSHPIILEHPVSGKKAIYCDVGYVVHVDGASPAESEAILSYLFAHQMQLQYKYAHTWTVGDVLVWDNLWTMHNAIADYKDDEPRMMRRCQVMADWVFKSPESAHLKKAAAAAAAKAAAQAQGAPAQA